MRILSTPMRCSYLIVLMAFSMQACGSPGEEISKPGLSSATTMMVTATAGLVSIEAQNAPLGAVLTEFGRRTQIAFLIPEAMKSESVTLSFQRRPVEDVLQQVLIGKFYAVEYRQDGAKKVIARVDLSVPQGPMVSRASAGSPFSSVPTANGSSVRSAPTSIGNLGTARTDLELAQLEQSLRESQEPAARIAALNGIAHRETSEAVNPIIAQALSDRAPEVREAALDVLKYSLDPVPIPALAAMASKDANPAFRVEAMMLLMDQLAKDEPSQEDRDTVLSLLNRGLTDPDPAVREFATMQLVDK